MFTEAQLFVLSADRKKHQLIKTLTPKDGDSDETFEARAYNEVRKLLDVRFPGIWRYAGQFQFTEGIPGGLVPAYIHMVDPEAEAQQEAARLKAEAAQKAKLDALNLEAYVNFGYGDMDKQITADGELLASLTTLEGLEDDAETYLTAFHAQGGSDGHSGYSWGCVKNVAAVLLKHGWKRVAEMPTDHPLAVRVVREAKTPA